MEPANTWNKAEAIFIEALDRPEHLREGFVREYPGADELVVEEVMRLLEAYGRMGDFLDASVLDFRGEQFGAYRAVEEIGRGGMSVVYAGQRIDGGFDKKVAIKVVLTHLGVAPETRILAALEHPHIARLLDAGATSLGFRYLVMELVEGVPCTEYAPARTDADKLKLFLQVCAGVQAAHQSLIVHRDLKPDNILVTREGQVKLLDFGIAKMLAPTGTQTVGPRAFTIEYASPEQILGQPASTANDVYSLGAVLFEWLTGNVPQELGDVPLDEAIWRLRESPQRQRNLPRDLDLIVRKALAYDPALRYESPGALARDIELYLTGKPVAARPSTWAYRAGKFVARHRFSVSAATAAVLALAGVAAYAAYQARLAESRFQQVRALSRSVLFELHDSVAPLEGSLAVRRLIARRSQEYLDVLARDDSAGNEVLLDAARGYLRLSEVQNSAGGVDSPGQSESFARRGLRLARRMNGRSPGDREVRAVLIDALRAVAQAAIRSGSSQAAVEAAREAVARSEEALLAAREAASLRLAGLASFTLSRALLSSGEREAALAAAVQASARFGELERSAGVHGSPDLEVLEAFIHLTQIKLELGDSEGARGLAREALERAAALSRSGALPASIAKGLSGLCRIPATTESSTGAVSPGAQLPPDQARLCGKP